MVKAVRGAVSLEVDSPDELREKVCLLFRKLQEKNKFCEDSIISILFSQTPDISYNPAKALRVGAGIGSVPLFCTQEPVCVDFPQERMLRVLITFNRDSDDSRVQPVYLGKATELRADLIRG